MKSSLHHDFRLETWTCRLGARLKGRYEVNSADYSTNLDSNDLEGLTGNLGIRVSW